MKKKIKLGLAEDHELVRQGMVALLQREKGLRVVFDVSNGSLLLDTLRDKFVDVVLLDLDMPIINGTQALKIIKEKYPDIKVIIISMLYDDEFIWESIELGANGFLAKNCDFEKVVDAIYAVNNNDFYFDERISRALVTTIRNGVEGRPIIPGYPIITPREHKIIELICEEKKNQEISDILCISIRTVETHRKQISEKIGAKNSMGIIKYALKHGLYKLKV